MMCSRSEIKQEKLRRAKPNTRGREDPHRTRPNPLFQSYVGYIFPASSLRLQCLHHPLHLPTSNEIPFHRSVTQLCSLIDRLPCNQSAKRSVNPFPKRSASQQTTQVAVYQEASSQLRQLSARTAILRWTAWHGKSLAKGKGE